MEIIILGSKAAYPKYKGACSGYLVREGLGAILIDIGTGTLSNLFRWHNPFLLERLIVSHLHTDHFLDIYPLRYCLQYNPSLGRLPLRVLVPEGGESYILQLISENFRERIKNVFLFEEIKEGKIKVGNFNIDFLKVPHPIPTYAVSVEGKKGKKLVYSGDLSYDENLAKFAQGANVFICEATFYEKSKVKNMHLSGLEAGKLASLANVEMLILTHFWPTFDQKRILNEAKRSFRKRIILAEENLRVEV